MNKNSVLRYGLYVVIPMFPEGEIVTGNVLILRWLALFNVVTILQNLRDVAETMPFSHPD
jgi:hypothetical protein